MGDTSALCLQSRGMFASSNTSALALRQQSYSPASLHARLDRISRAVNSIGRRGRVAARTLGSGRKSNKGQRQARDRPPQRRLGQEYGMKNCLAWTGTFGAVVFDTTNIS